MPLTAASGARGPRAGRAARSRGGTWSAPPQPRAADLPGCEPPAQMALLARGRRHGRGPLRRLGAGLPPPADGPGRRLSRRMSSGVGDLPALSRRTPCRLRRCVHLGARRTRSGSPGELQQLVPSRDRPASMKAVPTSTGPFRSTVGIEVLGAAVGATAEPGGEDAVTRRVGDAAVVGRDGSTMSGLSSEQPAAPTRATMTARVTPPWGEGPRRDPRRCDPCRARVGAALWPWGSTATAMARWRLPLVVTPGPGW